MKQNVKKIIAGLTAGCMLSTMVLAGCTEPSTKQMTQENPNKVYSVRSNGVTTSMWMPDYGVVTHDGRMVIPFDSHEISIITDIVSGEQLWIQTRTQRVDDPTLTAEEVYEQWEKIHLNHILYDLEGNLIEELGEYGIIKVCDGLVLYQNGQLIKKDTGDVCFEDEVTNIMRVGDRYVMNYHTGENYDSYARVIDLDLNVIFEAEGNFTELNGQYYIIKRENGKSGLCDLDGKEIVPCEYGWFSSYYNVDVPYVSTNIGSAEAVVSLEDGSVIYQETGEYPSYDYIQYLLPDGMILQKREQIGISPWGTPQYEYYTRLYDYSGNPIGERYRQLYPETGLYRKMLAESKDAELLYSATTEDGTRQILNSKFEVIYTVSETGYVNILGKDRIIIQDFENNQMGLYTMDGKKLNEKEYKTDMFSLYYPYSGDINDYRQSDYLQASYPVGRTMVYDLLDIDGNVLIENLKSVQLLSDDRLWVEKGFSKGLMDMEGNWIYEQSLFDSAAEE